MCGLQVVSVLAPDLLARLQEELQASLPASLLCSSHPAGALSSNSVVPGGCRQRLTGPTPPCTPPWLQDSRRRPATLTVKWRHAGKGWERSSASCAMPSQVLSNRAGEEQQASRQHACCTARSQDSRRYPCRQGCLGTVTRRHLAAAQIQLPACLHPPQVAAIAAAALGLLRRSLLEPFDLSLINLGATAFSEGPAGAGAAAGTRNIAEMFAAGRTAAAGAAAAAAATAGVSEAASQEPPAAQAAPSPQNQPATMLAYSRAAAEASAQQRRSYSTAPLQAPLLSKRAERQLREQSAQLLQQQQAHGPPPASPQALQQQPHHGSFGFGFDGQHDEEGDDASMWADLQDLAAWRSDSGRRHSPKLAAAGLAGGEVRCDVGLAQQQGAVAAPPAGSVAVQQGKQEPGEAGEQEAGAVGSRPPPQAALDATEAARPAARQALHSWMPAQQERRQQEHHPLPPHTGSQAQLPPSQPQAKQARLPLASKPATYRNAEALAIQELFFYGGSSSAAGGMPSRALAGLGSSAPRGPAAADLPPEERASLELALQLQQEEVQAAAAARKRDVPPAGGAGRQHKQRRGGRGPLDAFFSCKG